MTARHKLDGAGGNLQRFWVDVQEGEALPTLNFPLSIYRMVVAAGANRDFNSIHHNSEYARASGAPDMYANILFLQGMWERLVRDYIGLAGKIHRISGFRMKIFNTVGDTVIVKATVTRKWQESGIGLVEFEIWSENKSGVSVGPGRVLASMPLAQAASV